MRGEGSPQAARRTPWLAWLQQVARAGALALACAAPLAASAQALPPAPAASPPTLFEMLQTGGRHWTLTHVCVLPEVAGRHTNQEFADAIVAFMKARWDRGMESRADLASLVGSVGHAATDLYWPGRVERNARGQIVRFRGCNELGGAPGLRGVEVKPVTSVIGDAEVGRKAADLLLQLRLVYQQQRSFANFVDELRRDALMIEPGRERDPLAH